MKDKGLSSEDSAENMDKRIEGAQEGVAYAMQGLEEMEMIFKRDIKRRKLQVEESVFKSTSDQMPRFRLQRSQGSSDVLSADRLLLTPEREPCEEGDQVEGEPVLGEDEEAVDQPPEAADRERGAKRAPAIHSDYLPLPWKGRLGYVGGPPAREKIDSCLAPVLTVPT